jgi:hypothetical protein
MHAWSLGFCPFYRLGEFEGEIYNLYSVDRGILENAFVYGEARVGEEGTGSKGEAAILMFRLLMSDGVGERGVKFFVY